MYSREATAVYMDREAEGTSDENLERTQSFPAG